MKLAYFSPLPPTRSGIADYSALLLSEIATKANVTAYVSPEAPAPTGLPEDLRWHRANDGRPDGLPLYQMGNSAHHSFLYRQLLQYSGITTLHEPFLHHFVAHITAGQGNFDGYAREMAYSYGVAGAQLAHMIRNGRVGHPLHSLPLVERIIDSSLAVVVHSQYAKHIVSRIRPKTPTAIIPLPMPICEREPADRKSLNIPADAMLIATAGQVTPEKQIPAILQALARLCCDFPKLHLLIIGSIPPDLKGIDEMVSAFGLETIVHRTGYVTDPVDFDRWIAAADILVNLRAPTLGETSAGLLRVMAQRKPAIVCDQGWYAELPRDTCCHIEMAKPGGVDYEALARILAELAASPSTRESIGQRASEYVKRHHRPADSASSYLSFITNVIQQHIKGRTTL